MLSFEVASVDDGERTGLTAMSLSLNRRGGSGLKWEMGGGFPAQPRGVGHVCAVLMSVTTCTRPPFISKLWCMVAVPCLLLLLFSEGGGGGGCVVRNRPCVEKQLEIAELCDMCVASWTLDVCVNFSPHLHLLRKVSCAFSWSVERRGLFRDGCMTARGHRQRTAWVCFARL